MNAFGNFGKGNLKKILIISAIFLVLVIAFVLLKINFLIGEQLRMTISPEYSEVRIVSPGNVSFKVDVKIYNKFVCDVSCDFSFTDLSGNIILDNGTFTSKVFKDKGYFANINLSEHGYGTKLYLYRIQCANIGSAVCISNGESLVRKSLMVVSYEPSSEQLAALFSSRESYSFISRNLANSSMILKDAQNMMQNISMSNAGASSVGISLDTGRYDSLKSEYDSLDSGLHNVLSLWDSDDFVSVQSYISKNNLSLRSSVLPLSALSYISYINDTITEHNILVSTFSSVYDSVSNYASTLSYIPDMSYNSYVGSDYVSDSSRKMASSSLKDWNAAIGTFNKGNYTKNAVYNDIYSLQRSTNSLNIQLINATMKKLSDDYPSLYVYSNILCRLYSYSSSASSSGPSPSNASGNISGNSSNQNNQNAQSGLDVKAYLCNNEYGLNISSMSDTSFKLSNICDRSSVILGHLGVLNTSENDSMELLLLQYKLLIDYGSLNGINPRAEAYMKNVSDMLSSKYNISGYDPIVAAAILSGYDFNYSIVSMGGKDPMIGHIRDIIHICSISGISSGNINSSSSAVNSSSNSSSGPSNSSDLSFPQAIKITVKRYVMPASSYNTSMIPAYPIIPPEVSDTCCIYDRCQSCNKSTSRNPLILLHGHSFDVGSDAYRSVEIFDAFEDKLARDGLYYPTGMLIYNSNSTRGILGKFDVPIVSKPTYYIETYNDLLGLTVSESKTSNIDTYVLRLKESIDYTRYITGKDKVDIVTHSMGGLVVRRYMQVFGTDSLGTVILIASPNGGISSTTFNLCKIFGSSNECDDMNSDGLFIKKLNDLSDQPNMDHVYLVIGKGCSTSGVDGDGVITAESSLMNSVSKSHILYVDGNCTGTNYLHNNMLNIYDYPQVYDFVKSKLEAK